MTDQLQPQQRRFEVVQDDEETGVGVAGRTQQAATQMLMMALAALSKRAVIALESMFTLITVGLVFWAALSILENPTNNQLAGLAIFSIFVLTANWLVLKRRQ